MDEIIERKNKRLKLKGENWSCEAIGIALPSKDVAVQLTIKIEIEPIDVAEEKLRINKIVRKWFWESGLDKSHFIYNLTAPDYPAHTRKRIMAFVIDFNVATINTIETTKKALKEAFLDELEGLIEELGLQ